jgi:hypothetical protein
VNVLPCHAWNGPRRRQVPETNKRVRVLEAMSFVSSTRLRHDPLPSRMSALVEVSKAELDDMRRPSTSRRVASVSSCSVEVIEEDGNQAISDQSRRLKLSIHSNELDPKITQRRETLNRFTPRSTRTNGASAWGSV